MTPTQPAKAEPAAIGAGIAAAVNAVVLFSGIDLDEDTKAAIVTVVTLLAGLFIRSKVTPVA